MLVHILWILVVYGILQRLHGIFTWLNILCRDFQIDFPGNDVRPLLSPIQLPGCTDYINAVYINVSTWRKVWYLCGLALCKIYIELLTVAYIFIDNRNHSNGISACLKLYFTFILYWHFTVCWNYNLIYFPFSGVQAVERFHINTDATREHHRWHVEAAVWTTFTFNTYTGKWFGTSKKKNIYK